MDLMEEGNVSCGVNNCSTPGNCSNQDCQEEETMSGWIFIGLIVIYVPLMLFGLLGNILTLLVVWLRPNMRNSAYLYLSSMAVSDLLFLLLLALDVLKAWTGWKFGVIVCKLNVFLSDCCIFCTILHITCLSVERYLAVCWPITSKTLVTRRRTKALIGCLWLGAAVSAAPVLVMMEVEDERIFTDETCALSISVFNNGIGLAIIILYYLYVLVPLCILGLVFILIGRTLRLRPQSSSKDKSNQHAIKMLGVIVLAFVLCWLPYIVSMTMIYVFITGPDSTHNNTHTDSTHNNTHTDSTHNYTHTYSTHNNTHTDSTHNYTHTDSTIYYNQMETLLFLNIAWYLSRLSAAINPLVYHLMSARYRHAVRSLVQTHCLTPSH